MKSEIRVAVKKLKNNKSSFSDKIKNEMIKSAVNELMPVYLKLFNTVLRSVMMPQTWCNGIITPIFKSGVKSDPSNYRGICISSCLGKLFRSILNQRLLDHVKSLDILHKSEIGFLANNRTADDVLTLRTLIDKYTFMVTRPKYMHALLTSEKPSIRFGTMDFRTSYYNIMSEGNLLV